MGTLYDLLGALPSDDAEGLRTAFRKAAKATHPDINPDNPDAALRFRELVRAYDILTDAEQRATYDQLLAIALQPSPATTAVRTYEVIGKVASNTMAATVISAVLVGGYVLFGLFSKPPGAAEIAPERIFGEAQVVAALHPEITAPNEPRVQPEGDVSTVEAAVTPAVAPAAKEANAASVGRFEPCAGIRPVQSGDSVLSALHNRQFRPRHRPVSRRRFRPVRRSRSAQTDDGFEAGKDRHACAAQATADPAPYCVRRAIREANADHRGLDALSAGKRAGHDFAASLAFFGRGGPSTGGSDFRYSAIAARSSGDNCDVFLITRAIDPPAVSPSGVCPVSRK